MLKAYPKIETTFLTINLNEYAIYADTFGHSSSKITYTIPRRTVFYIHLYDLPMLRQEDQILRNKIPTNLQLNH